MLSCNDAASYVCRCGSTTKQHAGAEQLVQLGLPLLCNAQQKRALLPLHDDAAGKCGHDRATRLWASGPAS